MKKGRFTFLIVLLFLFIQVSSGLGAEPKNVILVIGDGMGPQAVGLAIYYNLFTNGSEKPLNLEKLMAAGNTGYCLTYQYGTVVTDSASAVNIRLQASNTEAMLVGSVTGDLSLDMIPHDASVQVGDVVLTSGLGGTYPPNLLVGQVVSLRKLEYELFQQAAVQPNVDFSQLQFVLIITNFRPVDITPLSETTGQ